MGGKCSGVMCKVVFLVEGGRGGKHRGGVTEEKEKLVWRNEGRKNMTRGGRVILFRN